ncbi:aminotransferase class I/II-fold pyridoxal phosphate-dependent enzyme [Secundilactobacillus collinoides]|uniref:aminotransferase class I/II-fold pyridoxal phosphate-dependent enzyme n=1 Tax=Secundilactobacillus collinoides TaxID=33960 RepID=UPI0006D27409|nr:aminotransferase class I/II-fold pyridoxal phosphate-dependent enzyme [Secundilactobacillus collinoides]
MDNHIAIVHDFAYADISFEHQAPSFLQSKRAKETGIEIYTLSKTFNMAGWRSAFAVGNASIIKLLKATFKIRLAAPLALFKMPVSTPSKLKLRNENNSEILI